MSRRPTNRRAVWLAGVVATMPIVGANLPLAPVQAASARQFVPPSDPMVLTRTLRRPLPGGAEVLTRRSYEIHFIAEGDGYRIDGSLVGVEVEAPPALQALAMLERKRPDTDMFPMRIDASGMLRLQDAPAQSEEARLAALAVSEETQSLPLGRLDRNQASNFAMAFENRAMRSSWPEDLFHPAPGRREETRSVPLPNGARGTVRVSIDAHTGGTSGLLGSLVRKMTTDLDGDRRMTEETWTLTAKS